MAAEEMTGGCQCGRVRYRAQIASDDAYLCHCRMCQRATGGVSITYVNVPQGAVAWESGPDWYRSSPIAHRPFCSVCGTPLGFAFLDGDNIDLTIGSFDAPGRFVPTRHFGVESLHEAWLDTSALPRMNSADNPSVADRWIAATGKLPD
ncbi:MAG: GFA family protein [Sphingobium sp.]